MKNRFSWFLVLTVAAACCVLAPQMRAADSAGTPFVVTNNNLNGPNTISALALASGGLDFLGSLPTGGNGSGGGSFAISRAVVYVKGSDQCGFFSDSGSSDVAAFKKVN